MLNGHGVANEATRPSIGWPPVHRGDFLQMFKLISPRTDPRLSRQT
jgi:hypothetical protein